LEKAKFRLRKAAVRDGFDTNEKQYDDKNLLRVSHNQPLYCTLLFMKKTFSIKNRSKKVTVTQRVDSRMK